MWQKRPCVRSIKKWALCKDNQYRKRQGNCPVFFDKCIMQNYIGAELSFSGAKTYQKCVILSGVANGNEVEESSVYRIVATGKILRLRRIAATLRMTLRGSVCYIKKYSAMVSIAVFLSSSESPAISRRSKITIKSPVSKSLGSSCLRKFPGL